MSYFNLHFNAADLPTGQRQPLPAGDYDVTIESAAITPTKDGTGQYIKLAMKVTGPTHVGRFVYSNLNIHNKSPKAQEIGRQQLGDILRAVGLATITDPGQLVGGNLAVRLAIKPEQGQYEADNEVKSYRAKRGGV